MVTTVTSYSDSRHRANAGDGYDGVVRLAVAGYYGTGVLLFDGRAILTAAHLFGNGSNNATVTFETAAGTQSLTAGSVVVNPAYDVLNGNHDLALLWLAGAAPHDAERYTLYRDADEIGMAFTLVGYGTPGTGSAGLLGTYSGGALRLRAENVFDADIGTLKSYQGAAMAWSPQSGSQIVADFDDGTAAHDALGRLIYRGDTGLGQDEGLIAPGDSGGPAFIEGQLAGIASYSANLSRGSIQPDIDAMANSSFGEIAAWQRVSYYQQWIDQSLRAHYTNAPTTPEAVQKTLPEGGSGTSYAYFLLQFTGVRSAADQWLSVDYVTRDGTATAGEDYIALGGTLVLYPDESQAVIPVEIIGDTVPEPDETFYLDVFNPVGGGFGVGIVKLTAVRTIVNDDGGYF